MRSDPKIRIRELYQGMGSCIVGKINVPVRREFKLCHLPKFLVQCTNASSPLITGHVGPFQIQRSAICMFHYNVFTPNRVRGIVVPVDDIWDRNAGLVLHCGTTLAAIPTPYIDLRLTILYRRNFRCRDQLSRASDWEWYLRYNALTVVQSKHEHPVTSNFNFLASSDRIGAWSHLDDFPAQRIEVEFDVPRFDFLLVVTEKSTAGIGVGIKAKVYSN